MIVLLAFLPLQAWAGLGTSAAGVGMVQVPQTADVSDVARATLAVATDAAIADVGDPVISGAHDSRVLPPCR
jgi:hypothetical protein